MLRTSGEPGPSQTTAFILEPVAIMVIVSAQPERRGLIGYQGECVAVHPIAASKHPDHEIKDAARIRAGEQYDLDWL